VVVDPVEAERLGASSQWIGCPLGPETGHRPLDATLYAAVEGRPSFGGPAARAVVVERNGNDKVTDYKLQDEDAMTGRFGCQPHLR
jgi:hypothetical protein